MNTISSTNANVELLGLENDTISQFADRLLLRILDHPVLVVHLIDTSVGKDCVELIFDAMPLDMLVPFQKVVGDKSKIETFAFEREGKQVTGVRVHPENLKSEGEDGAAPDSSEDEEDTVKDAVGSETGNDVIEALLDSEEVSTDQIDETLADAGFDGTGCWQTAEEATAAAEEALGSQLPGLIEGAAGRRTVQAAGAKVVFQWEQGKSGYQAIAYAQGI